MADLIQTDTDEEMDKYAEAELIAKNPPPVAAIKKKTLNYNPTTGRNDVLVSLSSGGYVKVGDEELPRVEQVQKYARQLEGMPFDMADYEAAGFSAEEVQAAGVMPVEQEKTGRTEPLREGEELRLRREGEAIAAPYDPTLRQNTTDTLREIFVAAGLDDFQARQIAEGLIGNPNATRDLGIGVADFTPAGLFFGAQEGYRTFERGINTGDPTTIGMGALEAGLSLLEAVPLTAAGAKAAKAGIPTLRQALVDLGQGAEARIAERGDTTLFSNPMEPAVDQALAMAGRVAGREAPSATTPNQAGSAIKLYHGTDAPEFEQFDPSQARTAKHIYTSPIRDDAAAYGRNVLEFETDANILDLRADTRGVNETKVLRQAYDEGGLDDYFESFDDFVDAFDNGDMYQRFGSQNAQNAVIDELFAASGADGLRIPDAGFGGTLSESVVFEDPSKLQKVTEQPAKPSAAELRRQANIQRFGYDPNEAPATPDTSYRMEHQPTGPEGGEGIRLDDLTKNISGEQAGYPEDFYTPRGASLYAQGPSFPDDEYGMANQESYKVITSVRNNPDAEVTIYRAVPDEDAITTINPGDFVTLSRKYAELHGASGYGRSGDEPGKILEQKVKVRDIYWDGNDVNEFGYFPESSTASQSLPDMLEQKYPNVTLDISGDPERGYELSRIVIPEGERGEGMGTEVMQDMIDMADEQGARISLTPDVSFGGTSVARLKKFYKQFGFVENKGKNKDFSIRNTMYRNPQSTGGAD